MSEQERERKVMTDYEKFQETVKNRILDFMPEEYKDASVYITKVQKNNDQEQAALRIRRAGESITAILYLEPYYGEILDWIPEQEVLTHIAEAYTRAEQEKPRISGDSVKDFESVKDRIHIQLVNKETNRKSLENCVKREIENTDLVAVFRIMFYSQGREHGSALVTKQVMDLWNMDQDALYETALKNTMKKFPAAIFDVKDMLYGSVDPLEPEKILSEEDMLYVLSNTDNKNGASVLLYPGLLQSLADGSGSNFYILPSSIHECMLLKDQGDIDIQSWHYTVMETNRRVVDPKEVLSDQVYYYDGREQKLSMVTTPEETKEFLKSLEVFSDGYMGVEAESMEEEMER